MSLPKMRTAPQLAAEYRAADPDTPVNAHFIRNLMNTGAVPYIRAGKKHLINSDVFAEYLKNGMLVEPEAVEHGVIRPIRA